MLAPLGMTGECRWPQAHSSAAVADCPVIQLVPQTLLEVWTVRSQGAQQVHLCHSAWLNKQKAASLDRIAASLDRILH